MWGVTSKADYPVAVCPACGQHQKVLAVWDASLRIVRHLDGRGHMCPETEVPHIGSKGTSND